MAWNSTNIFTLLAMCDPRVVYLLLCYALRTCTSSEFFCTITTRTEEKLQTLTKNFLLYQDHTWLYAHEDSGTSLPTGHGMYMDRTVIFDLPLEAYKVWTQMVIQYIRWRNIPTGFNHRPQVGRSVLKILGCFKSAKIFICQKVQHFQADSEYLGKINTKKKKSNFFFNV